MTAIGILVAYRPAALVVVGLLGEDFIYEARVAPPVPDWQRLDRRGWTFALLMAVGGVACVAGYYRTRRPLLPATAALLLVALPSVLPEPAADAAPPGIATGPLGLEGPLRLPPRFSLSTRIRSPTTGLSARLRLPDRPVNVSTQLFLGSVHVAEGPFVPTATGLPVPAAIGERRRPRSPPRGAPFRPTRSSPRIRASSSSSPTRTRPGFATASSTWTRRPGCGSRGTISPAR